MTDEPEFVTVTTADLVAILFPVALATTKVCAAQAAFLVDDRGRAKALNEEAKQALDEVLSHIQRILGVTELPNDGG